MIDTEVIKRMKAEGEWIVSSATWKKWLENGKATYIGKTKQGLGYVPVFSVEGKTVKNDWLLTYGHQQYDHLIPVERNLIEDDEDN